MEVGSASKLLSIVPGRCLLLLLQDTGCPRDMLGLRDAGTGEPQVAPQLPLASSRRFKEENNPKFQCHVWIYKHMDSLWALLLSCSVPRGVPGFSPGTEAWQSWVSAWGEGAGLCPHCPCSILAPLPAARHSHCLVPQRAVCGCASSATALCHQRARQRPPGGVGWAWPWGDPWKGWWLPTPVQEPGCFASGLFRFFQGRNNLLQGALVEQLLCAALRVCAVVLVPTKCLESHRDAVQRGWAGPEDPPVVYRGCAHHPSCAPGSAGDISPSAQGLFMEVSPVSWPWWGFVPQQNPPGCCGAVSLLIPSLSFLHSLSQPKCHKPDGPGDTELYSASGLSVPWSWASSTSTAPTGSRSWGTEPRLAGRRGMLGAPQGWEMVSWILTPAHHDLVLGWELWRSPWSLPLEMAPRGLCLLVRPVR